MYLKCLNVILTMFRPLFLKCRRTLNCKKYIKTYKIFKFILNANNNYNELAHIMSFTVPGILGDQ